MCVLGFYFWRGEEGKTRSGKVLGTNSEWGKVSLRFLPNTPLKRAQQRSRSPLPKPSDKGPRNAGAEDHKYVKEHHRPGA